ncbi:MAG: ABC transporter permease [Nitrospiria bacterium]
MKRDRPYLISDTRTLFMKYLKLTWRMPMWTLFGLVQPLLWLLIFGQLFKGLSNLPNFPAKNYVQFLTPGVIVMTVLFGASWSGVSLLRDLRNGVMERLLVAPIIRSSIVLSRLLHNGFTVVIQVSLLIIVAALIGVGLPDAQGLFLVWMIVLLLSLGFSAISNSLAMRLQQEEPLVVMGNLLTLPLLFFSSALVPVDFMPRWMQLVSRVNPVSYGVEAVRACYDAQLVQPFWISIGFLAVFSGLSIAVAVAAFQKVE